MLFAIETMEPLFWALEETKGVTQNPTYHPEGDVFTHSLQTMELAFRETYDVDLILAAMLHDVGKVGGSVGHEKTVVVLLDCHCSAKTLWLIRQHMRIWKFILGKMRVLHKVREIVEHPWLPELMHLARLDRMARDPNKKIIYNKSDIVDRLNKCVRKHFERG